MKKYLMLFAGLFAIGCVFAGCRKESKITPTPPAAEATPTPVQETPIPVEDDGDLVNMRESPEEDETNIIGTKNAGSLMVELVNETDNEVAGIYVRAHDSSFDDDEWGDELIQGKFTLKKSEKALYYFDRGSGDEDGLYDLRISYVDRSLSEFFYRKIPLDMISRLSFCVDKSEGVVVPYATYLTSSGGTRELSTLNEVRKRLGLTYDDEGDEEEPQEEVTPTPSEGENGNEEELTPVPENPYEDPDDQPQDPAAEAENYIGRPLEELIGTFGQPNGNDYQDEPETGETGYHYYDTFTVSTTVDAEGNEVVAGVW